MKTDNLGYYTERDFDEVIHMTSRVDYREEAIQHYFLFETYKNPGWDVEERELVTDIKLIYKIHPGNYSSQAVSPDEYYGYSELVAYDHSNVVEFSTGEKVDPKSVLSPQEYETYMQEIADLIDDYS